MSELTDIEFDTMAGDTSTLDDFAGDVLLVVNVASKCGLTPQYEGLQQLHSELADQGFSVLGLPGKQLRRTGAGHRRRDRRVLHHQLRRELSGVLEDQCRGPRPASSVRRPHRCATDRRRQSRDASGCGAMT